MLRTQLACLSLLLAFTQTSFAGSTSSKNVDGTAPSNATSSDAGCEDSGLAPVANTPLSKNSQSEPDTNQSDISSKTVPDTMNIANPE